jgi:hypothetical protein
MVQKKAERRVPNCKGEIPKSLINGTATMLRFPRST